MFCMENDVEFSALSFSFLIFLGLEFSEIGGADWLEACGGPFTRLRLVQRAMENGPVEIVDLP